MQNKEKIKKNKYLISKFRLYQNYLIKLKIYCIKGFKAEKKLIMTI